VSSQAKIGTRRTDRWAARGGGEGREGYGVRKGYDSWRSREKRRRGRTVVERGWGRARGADKKNEEATRTVEGMPSDERRRAAARARLLSRFQKTLPPCRVFALARYKRETERERERERERPRSSLSSSSSSVDRSPPLLAMDGHTRVHAIVLVPGDGGPLIPPGASLVTHAALLTRPSPVPALVPRVRVYPRVRPALPSTSTRRRGILSFFLSFGSPPVPPIPPLRLSVRLFLFHSPAPLQPATPHRRRASGDTRGPTQVMHGPPYIFDPLFGLLFPTERTMPLPLPLSPLPLRRTRARARFSFSWRCRALGEITIVPVSLSTLRLLPPLVSLALLISGVCNTLRANILGETAPVTPVIVRLSLKNMRDRPLRGAMVQRAHVLLGGCAWLIGSLMRRNRPSSGRFAPIRLDTPRHFKAAIDRRWLSRISTIRSHAHFRATLTVI